MEKKIRVKKMFQTKFKILKSIYKLYLLRLYLKASCNEAWLIVLL